MYESQRIEEKRNYLHGHINDVTNTKSTLCKLCAQMPRQGDSLVINPNPKPYLEFITIQFHIKKMISHHNT